MEFTIDSLDSLSIRNNWCSWCVNVFYSDLNGDWISVGTGLLSFFGKKKGETALKKVQDVRELRAEPEEWDPEQFIMQVKTKKNLGTQNSRVQVDAELKKRLAPGGGDLLLHCELKRANQWCQNDLVIQWFQEDVNEHLALSFISAVTVVESWQVICEVTGTSLQDMFRVEKDYLDYMVDVLENREEELVKKKIVLAVFSSKSDGLKALLKIYREEAGDRRRPEAITITNYMKLIQKLLVLLLEFTQLDILLHVLEDDVFLEVLTVLEDLHRTQKGEAQTIIRYRAFFENETKFENFCGLPQSVTQSVRNRFKLMYLRDYVFAEHPREEFISWITSVLEIPNSSIFIHLAEHNQIFADVLQASTDKAKQFFAEFFSIYKALPVESKAVFSVTFFMKGLHLQYISYIYSQVKSGDQKLKERVLDPLDLLGLLLTSKKDHAARIFGGRVAIEGKNIGFADALVLVLLDSFSPLRDCGLNLLALMTESLQADRQALLGLISNYLLPPLTTRLSGSQVSSAFLSVFLRLMALCIDKEHPAQNTSFAANITAHQVISKLLPHYASKRSEKSLRILFLQLVSSLMILNDEPVEKQVLENHILDEAWMTYLETRYRPNILHSASLRIFSILHNSKSSAYLEYVLKEWEPTARAENFEVDLTVRQLMQKARQTRAEDASVQGNFSVEKELESESKDQGMLLEVDNDKQKKFTDKDTAEPSGSQSSGGGHVVEEEPNLGKRNPTQPSEIIPE